MADTYGSVDSNRRSSKTHNFSKESFPRTSNSGEAADDLLEALGYTSELTRNRTTLSVTFMSFVLASVPYGLSTTLIYPLTGGGTSTIIWGWVAVCMLMLCVAISLGEITSVYPLAGGVYYQTFMLSPPWCRKLSAWLTGWCFMLGNITITLAVNFGTTLFLIGCINIFRDAEGNGIFQAEAYQAWLIFLAITLLCNVISAFGNKWLPLLDTATVVWTFLGLVAIIACTLAIAKEGRNSAEYVFSGFEVTSGWTPPGWAFCIGLLHGAYSTSATGMVVSMCEEVRKPATQVPKAIVGAIILNMVCGLVFLIPLCFVIRDISAIVNDPSGSPVPVILRSAIGNETGAFLLCVPIIILGLLCGTGCTTASSRCTWAFARDGAIPGSRKFGFNKVNTKLGVPLNAMMLIMIVEIVLGLIYLGNSAAFNAFGNSGVIFLTLSYVIPVAISFFTGRKSLSAGKYDLKLFGAFCNVVSIAWCLFVIPLFSMPSVLPATVINMNYACVVFIGGLAISLAWYYIWGRKNYQGPKVTEDATADGMRRMSTASIPRV